MSWCTLYAGWSTASESGCTVDDFGSATSCHTWKRFILSNVDLLVWNDDVTVKLFADDLKMYVTVNNIKDCQVLQYGLNILYDWTIKWQLNISISKCAVLRLGNHNVSFTYNFNNQKCLWSRVLIDGDLKFSSHTEAMVMLRLICEPHWYWGVISAGILSQLLLNS